MPARGGPGQQRLSASRLDGCVAVGHLQPMLSAVGLEGLLHDPLPELQEPGFAQDEVMELGLEGTAQGPPAQPLSTPLVHTEVEQSSEADTYDWVLLPAVLIALFNELMVEEGSSSKCTGLEGPALCIQILRV